MNILLLFGSPHMKGTTDMLATSFEKGATAAGHIVKRFDVAKLDIHSCLGCNHCRENNEVCVYQDDMQSLHEPLLQTDMVVFVTPTYYFGICSQLKKVIDRFYAINGKLKGAPKKACLLAACGDRADWAIRAVEANYVSICRYLGWENAGEVLAIDVNTREDISKTDAPAQAEKLGASL